MTCGSSCGKTDVMTTGDQATSPKKRQRSPSPNKTEATRRALVDAALATFLEHGFSSTRMSDVATRAGFAKGTIYLHFADKAALFADVLREVMREARAGQPTPRPRPNESTGDFLRRAALPMLRGLQASGRSGVVRLVASEGTRFPELARAYRSVAIEPVLRLVRIIARRAERRGELRSDALSRMPMLLVAPAVITTLWNSIFAAAEPLDVADVFEAYLDLLFSNDGSR
jgi:TetR/AcrR family transcriptional regulator, regulator of autoinduction and epiphytic fitness